MTAVLVLLALLFSQNALSQVNVYCGSSGGLLDCLSTNPAVQTSLPRTVANPTGGQRSTSELSIDNKYGDIVFLMAEPSAPTGLVSVLTDNKGNRADYQMLLPGVHSQGQPKRAHDVNLVGDLFGRVNVDVSGYRGQDGKRTSQLCMDKIDSGFFGASAADDMLREYRAANSLSVCDSGMLSEITRVAPASFCPPGYDYKPDLENSTSQSFVVNRRRFMNKCQRSVPRKTCNFSGKVYSCGIRRNEMCEYTLQHSTDALSSTLGTLPRLTYNQGGYCESGGSGGFTTIGRITSATFGLPEGTTTVVGNPTGTATNPVTACANAIDEGSVRFGWTGSGFASGQSGYYPEGSVPWSFTATEIGTYEKSVSTLESCEVEAAKLGVKGYEGLTWTETDFTSDAQYDFKDANALCDQGWINSGLTQDYPFSDTGETVTCSSTSCPQASLRKSFQNYYGGSLIRESGQSGSFGGKINMFVYDLDSMDIKFANGSNGKIGTNDLVQTPQTKYCARIVDNQDNDLVDESKTASIIGTNFTLSAVPSFSLKVGDTITLLGSSETRRITVLNSATSGTLDRAFEANATDTPVRLFHAGLELTSLERKAPAINLHVVTFFPFTIQDPSGIPNVSFPQRTQTEAIGLFKKMDSATRDFLFRQIIQAAE